MKIYPIKYCLSNGGKIEPVEADIKGDYGYAGEDFSRIQYKMGRDAFPNPITALAQAKKFRDKKIASLEKQIAKLKGLVFEVVE